MADGVAVKSRVLDEATPRVSQRWRRMRILSVTPYYYPTHGGGGLYVREISERLARRGHDVAVLVVEATAENDPRPGRVGREVRGGVQVVRVSPRSGLRSVVDMVARLPGGYRILHSVLGTDDIRMVADEPLAPSAFTRIVAMRPAVVAVSNWYHPLAAHQAMIAARLARARVVGLPFFHTEEPWSRSTVYRRLLRWCDAVVVMTEHERRFVMEMAPERCDIHVVAAGIDATRFEGATGAAVRARYGIGDGPVVGYVGRVATNKGVLALIESMKLVWPARPDVYLLLAGSRELGGLRSTRLIDEALAALPDGQRRRVVDVGPFPEQEKPGLFDACDVFAMPSRAESFGIAYVEAWMCRKPVIGGRIGATACLVEDGVDGVLVEPESIREIASAILRLLEAPQDRRAMGEAGFRKAIRYYTWGRVATAMEGICLGLLGRDWAAHRANGPTSGVGGA